MKYGTIESINNIAQKYIDIGLGHLKLDAEYEIYVRHITLGYLVVPVSGNNFQSFIQAKLQINVANIQATKLNGNTIETGLNENAEITINFNEDLGSLNPNALAIKIGDNNWCTDLKVVSDNQKRLTCILPTPFN